MNSYIGLVRIRVKPRTSNVKMQQIFFLRHFENTYSLKKKTSIIHMFTTNQQKSWSIYNDAPIWRRQCRYSGVYLGRPAVCGVKWSNAMGTEDCFFKKIVWTLLFETRWEGSEDYCDGDYRIIYTREKQSSNGTAIVLNKKCGNLVENTIHHSDRIIAVKLK